MIQAKGQKLSRTALSKGNRDISKSCSNILEVSNIDNVLTQSLQKSLPVTKKSRKNGKSQVNNQTAHDQNLGLIIKSPSDKKCSLNVETGDSQVAMWRKNVSLSNKILREIMNYSSKKQKQGPTTMRIADQGEKGISKKHDSVLNIAQNHKHQKKGRSKKLTLHEARTKENFEISHDKTIKSNSTKVKKSLQYKQTLNDLSAPKDPVICSIRIDPFKNQNLEGHHKPKPEVRQRAKAQSIKDQNPYNSSAYEHPSSRRSSISIAPKSGRLNHIAENSNPPIKMPLLLNQEEYGDSYLSKIVNGSFNRKVKNNKSPACSNSSAEKTIEISHRNFEKQQQLRSMATCGNGFEKNDSKCIESFCSEESMGSDLSQSSSKSSSEALTATQQQRVIRLQQLEVALENVRQQAPKFIEPWDKAIECLKTLKRIDKRLPKIQRQYLCLQESNNKLKLQLFYLNRDYVARLRSENYKSDGKKQNILFEVERLHKEILKKVFRKELEETMCFNMRVVLPSVAQDSSLLASHRQPSCGSSELTDLAESSQNRGVLTLYEKLFEHKASKKYAMILRKEINNMNMFDSKNMNEYLKKLTELETAFHKVTTRNQEAEKTYYAQVESLVLKIQSGESLFERIKAKRDRLQGEKQYCSRSYQEAQHIQSSIINQLAEEISGSYQTFLTGGNSQKLPSNSQIEEQNVNLSFHQQSTESFKTLLQQKYSWLFIAYENAKDQRERILGTEY